MSDGSPQDNAAADGNAIRPHPRRRVDGLEDRTATQPAPAGVPSLRWA
ncbi:hypothetical protein HT576_01640 [Haloterrigena sp. SYSU A121-1]|uniref:Uncharacterized protein n=1 Tax=Haloterrigena gelatinilytica TaxID=2741724 RepID=A0A8J8GK08_9EURY|nr:hypothetical protein [Haloterrigena gelatinilytica]NUB89737.1 hypothetical protein [Haloterrigena gelatinilytica]